MRATAVRGVRRGEQRAGPARSRSATPPSTRTAQRGERSNAAARSRCTMPTSEKKPVTTATPETGIVSSLPDTAKSTSAARASAAPSGGGDHRSKRGDDTGHGERVVDRTRPVRLRHCTTPSAGRRSGNPSRGNWSSWKIDDLGDRPAADPQDVDRQRQVGAARAPARGRRRSAGCRLTEVRTRTHVTVSSSKPSLDPVAQHRVTADVEARRGRHRVADVIAQHRGDRVDVLGHAGVGEAAHQLTRRGVLVATGPVLPLGGQVLPHAGAGPLQRTVDGVDRVAEQLRDVLRRPAEHVPQDQRGPRAGREVLDRNNVRQLDRLPGDSECSRARPRHPRAARRAGGPDRAAATAPRRRSPARGGAWRAGRGRHWSRSGRARPGTSTAPRRSPAGATHAGTSPGRCPRRPRTTRASGSSARAAPAGAARPAPRMPPRRPHPDHSRPDPPVACPHSSHQPSVSSCSFRMYDGGARENSSLGQGRGVNIVAHEA